jgi:LPXTG-site transpeptidase (sortase) family protein
MRKSFTLSRANNVLLGLIILINAYIIITPVVPQIIYFYEDHYTNRFAQLQKQILYPRTPVKTSSGIHTTSPAVGNTLIVPSMLLNQPIYEGPVRSTYQILAKGIWIWPNGSTPDKGGNTILIGHRFTYTNPKGVFYELDKVKINDMIGVVWDGKSYEYKVSNIQVVPPSQTAILAQTSQPELTLYTCTTLLNPVNRLVVTADLIGSK